MSDVTIEKARKDDAPYIEEKLKKYILDSDNAAWQQFFVAKCDGKTVAFARIIDHVEFFEVASVGVDYYYRKRGIGCKMLAFLAEEAKRLDSHKPIYAVTHRPGFLGKVGFKEVDSGPAPLEYKKHHKCILPPSKIKIMRLTP